jgi:hypothetical protein
MKFLSTAILCLEPLYDNVANYQVEVVLCSDDAVNLAGMATLPNGTQYAVCTTLHYFGYKPASNATWLIVEPQSTQVMQQTKTPEQMQQTESSGWFRVKLGIGKGFIFRVFPRVLFSAYLEPTILLQHFGSDTYSP